MAFRGIAEAGITPLDFLLKVMREPEPVQRKAEKKGAFLCRYRRWDCDRQDAAKAAAPYVHPRLAAVEHTGDQKHPIAHSLRVEFVKAAPKRATPG